MKKVRVLLMEHLKTLHPHVFFERATKQTDCPYLVVSFLPALDDGESRVQIPIDIDGWDNRGEDTARLEALMETVSAGLNKKILSGEDVTVVFYRDTMLSLLDDESRIRRRKHVFQAHVYEGS